MEHKKNDFIVMFLSVSLLISVFIAGFFAYRTQNLVKEITKLRVVPTPIATPTPTPDPTADWKTYTNYDYGFSFKYPTEITVKEEFLYDSKSIFTKSEKPLMLYLKDSSNKSLIYIDPELPLSTGIVKEHGTKLLGTISVNYEKYENTTHYSKLGNKTLPLFSIDVYTSRPEIDQILSTFKFIEPTVSASPFPVACTMDAKICPDGSSVGRSGPKCEFAPCPTPKN